MDFRCWLVSAFCYSAAGAFVFSSDQLLGSLRRRFIQLKRSVLGISCWSRSAAGRGFYPAGGAPGGAGFFVKLVASSAPAELSSSPHQLLCSHLQADLLEKLLYLRLFMSAAELVLFFHALRAASSCFEAPSLIHSQLVANQLVDISVRSSFSQISYGELSRALGVLAFSLDPFRHLFQSFGKHTFLSLVGLQSNTSEYIWEHCDVLSMQMDSDLVIYRTTLVRTFQVVTICRVDKSESTKSVFGKWVYLVTLVMSLFDLQDVCIAISSLATLDLPMVADLIGIYVLKGPYCTLTTTNWFLQALSVIPRGSWRDVARRFTMIRWGSPKL
ncbi:potassium:hydrogen antiporter [Dorcoceras hygrometricum]|uniref:Potassium:hydrogen antiporter n=1 Tax=Dorcoceras hygrometricum TaxID=472368 RepID=A0A2Z7D1I8_9LAMI|nr:potassium:hydrogen antiporter [Dorcoceras hygrometricum]